MLSVVRVETHPPIGGPAEVAFEAQGGGHSERALALHEFVEWGHCLGINMNEKGRAHSGRTVWVVLRRVIVGARPIAKINCRNQFPLRIIAARSGVHGLPCSSRSKLLELRTVTWHRGLLLSVSFGTAVSASAGTMGPMAETIATSSAFDFMVDPFQGAWRVTVRPSWVSGRIWRNGLPLTVTLNS